MYVGEVDKRKLQPRMMCWLTLHRYDPWKEHMCALKHAAPRRQTWLVVEHMENTGTGYISMDHQLCQEYIAKLETIGKKTQVVDWVTRVTCALGTWAGSTSGQQCTLAGCLFSSNKRMTVNFNLSSPMFNGSMDSQPASLFSNQYWGCSGVPGVLNPTFSFPHYGHLRIVIT